MVGAMLTLVFHSVNKTFGHINVGFHSLTTFLVNSSLYISISVILRHIIKFSILPFESMMISFLAMPFQELGFKRLRIIPCSGTFETLSIWMDLPAEQRYDLKARSAVKRGMLTTQICFVFGAAYPLLGGVFFQSGVLVRGVRARSARI